MAWAPAEPKNVRIGGIVAPSTKLKWDKGTAKNVIGYKVYWRLTTSSQWEFSRFVGNVDQFELEGIVIDNYYFGVASVSNSGHESVVVFPNDIIKTTFKRN